MDWHQIKKLTKDEIRVILSSMLRGQGYFDFIKVEVCFNRDGEFRIYHNGKLNKYSTSLKQTVEDIYWWLNV
ncbi:MULTISPECIES: hypothetical protein [Acinetobacter]|jgi:hypothetical protein|uniref:Uncharacterized protein n=1 Tax=Acinetobacter lwoffii NIPH 478 TaxID=1217668 RepID=N9HFN1_ACILW|nr:MULTISPECIES: hypothetical protein [Acinetobacter]ENW30640.1 hypothetical protein F923_01209 [Acinetobacter lwoffii NIPH 478]